MRGSDLVGINPVMVGGVYLYHLALARGLMLDVVGCLYSFGGYVRFLLSVSVVLFRLSDVE